MYLPKQTLTLESAHEIINRDIGFYGLKDINGYFLNCTTEVLQVFSTKKLKCREEVFGKHDIELCDNVNVVKIYQDGDEIARTKKNYLGIEPAFINNKYTYLLARKLPICDKLDNVIGTFFHAFFLEQSHLTLFFDQLQQQQALMPSTKEFCETSGQDKLYQLTSRESECLFYTIRGKTAKDIARILNISAKTVEYHMEQIKTKLGCYNKSELIAKAIDLGYLNKIPTSILSVR